MVSQGIQVQIPTRKKKVADDITIATSDRKGLSMVVKLTTQNTQAKIRLYLLPLPYHQSPQEAMEKESPGK